MENVWAQAKTAIKSKIPDHRFQMWIDPLDFLRIEDGSLVLSCPNPYFRKRVRENYGPLIAETCRELTGSELRLSIEISDGRVRKTGKTASDGLFRVSPQLNLPGMNIYPSAGCLLRKDYTFDRFVVGKNNSFAYSAALSLASSRLLSQGSLYLMSGTGLGKSHLSQAIGHHILSRFPTENVYYVTAEDFTNEMIHAFRNDAIDRFKEKYRRKCDVLLMEDIHFLTGKDRTQMELTQALDYLLNADKKIIFTSCFSPKDIPRLNEQLRSRLTSGLISNIEPPDFKTRLKILRTRTEEKGCPVPRDVLEYIAGELSENVRELESGLIGVAAKASLTGESIDLNLAESVVRNLRRQARTISVDLIKEVVSTHYNVTVTDLISKSRKRHIVRPRQMAIYLSRKYTDQPLQTIGRSFNRYHSTVIHSIAAVEKEVKADRVAKKQLDYLCEKLEENRSPA